MLSYVHFRQKKKKAVFMMIHWRNFFCILVDKYESSQFQPRTTFFFCCGNARNRSRTDTGWEHRTETAILCSRFRCVRCTQTRCKFFPFLHRARKIASLTSRVYCVFQSGYQMYHHPARRATLNTGILRNVPSNFACERHIISSARPRL